jgi:dihydroxy-acid dehydratase
VEDGDTIVVDSKSRAIDWQVNEEEKARRREAWEISGKSALREKRGILFRYARDVAVSFYFDPLSCLTYHIFSLLV